MRKCERIRNPNTHGRRIANPPERAKRQQEQASLLRVNDSFKKIIITGEECLVHRNEYGFTTMSIYDFLLNPNSLEL